MALHIYDSRMGNTFLRAYVPDDVVFNVFVVFGGLVAGFRTQHALSRYTDAAAFLHKLNACWYDSASTLIAFCRNSEAPEEEVTNFVHTLVRLMSILSALCLDGLQQRDGSGVGHRFEVIGADELDKGTQAAIFESKYKVECVFQMIQQVVVDAIETKVLSIAPPILSRSFQEMGAGLLTYHEAKKLACVPLPKAYLLFTATILVCEALFVPWMLALYTRGAFSTFFYTFCGVFLLWFLNFVANALDNPFQKAARTLDASGVQRELNQHLLLLLAQAQQPAPYTEASALSTVVGVRRGSFHSWQNEAPASVMDSTDSVDSISQPRTRALRRSLTVTPQPPAHGVQTGEGADLAPFRGEWQQLGQSPCRSSGVGLASAADSEQPQSAVLPARPAAAKADAVAGHSGGPPMPSPTGGHPQSGAAAAGLPGNGAATSCSGRRRELADKERPPGPTGEPSPSPSISAPEPDAWDKWDEPVVQI